MKSGILFISLVVISFNYSLSQSATITLNDIEIQQGESDLYIPISVNTGEDGVATGQFFIGYDPSVIQPVDITYKSVGMTNFPSYEWLNNLNYNDNTMLLTWLQAKGSNIYPDEDEIICTLHLKIMKIVDSTELMFSQMSGVSSNTERGLTTFYNEKSIPLDMTYMNGKIYPPNVSSDN